MSTATIQPGRGTEVRRIRDRFALNAKGGRTQWRHPWQTVVRWSTELKEWVAFVAPGLVNGRAPVVRTSIAELTAATGKDWGINPLTGQPYFSAWVFKNDSAEEVRRQIIGVPLYLTPAIRLRWTPVGWDGLPGSTPLEFFRKRGAAARPGLAVDASTDLALQDTSALTGERPRGLRLLRRCDIILHQPRRAVSSSFQFLDPIAGQGFARQTITLTEPGAEDELRIDAGAFDATPNVFNPLQGYTEDAYDELLISSIYMLSPVGAASEQVPNEKWVPFVKHECFWNLSHTTPPFVPVTVDPGANPLLPLAAFGAGILLPIIQYTWSVLSDAYQQALNLITASSQRGSFWVPTGGGSVSAFPAEPAPEPIGSTGFDHSGALRRQQLAQQRAQRGERLDPDFPYFARSFPTSLLT